VRAFASDAPKKASIPKTTGKNTANMTKTKVSRHRWVRGSFLLRSGGMTVLGQCPDLLTAAPTDMAARRSRETRWARQP
jgi:hypothetical protein